MEKITEHKIVLNWSHEGRFSATIINGKITDVTMCEPGTGEENLERCLRSINPIFLRNVYNSLGELFKVQEEEEERLGYKYAKTPDNIQEIAAPDYPDPDKHWSMNKPRIAEKS